jgi:hypothetical protein
MRPEPDAERAPAALKHAARWRALEARIEPSLARRERTGAREGGRLIFAAALGAVAALAINAMLPRSGRSPAPAASSTEAAPVLAAAAAAEKNAAAPAPAAPRALPPELLGARIELGAGSAAHKNERGEIVLDEGSLRAELEPRPKGAPPAVFQAGDLSIEVVGTVFALRLDRGVGSVRVYEGAVVARRPGAPPERVDAASGVVPAEERWTPSRETAAIDAWGRQAAETRLSRKAATRPAAVALAGPVVPRSEPRNERPKGTPRAKIERAYATPAAVEGHRAELAAYKHALALLRAGRAFDAAEAFGAYLEHYPSGILRDEAELSRVESFRAAQAWPELRAEAELWLRRHPGDPRSEEVRAMLGDPDPR